MNVFSGGNGSGKTMIATNILGNLCWGPQNDWFDNELFRTFKRPFRGRIVSTHKNISESIIPKLKQYFPATKYITRKEKQSYEAKWITDLGCEFDIMTYDTDPKQFEGPTVHFVWFDEPPPQTIFGSCVSRLREGGFVIITMTPLYDGAWIFDRIDNPFADKDSSKWFLVMADVEDNCKDHGARGTLTHDNIDRMIAEYPSDEREARKSGKPIALSGRVYSQFNKNVHVIPRSKIPTKGTLIHVNDPHDRKPFALGWYILDDTGDLYVVGEWPNTPYHEMKSSSLVIKDYKDIILDKEKDLGLDAETRIIDARYGNRKSVHTDSTIRDEFDSVGLTYINSYTEDKSSIVAGHQKVKKLLSYDRNQDISSTNKPKLYICDDCINHIYGMLHYGYEEEKNPAKAIKEGVKLVFKDFPDLVRYAVSEFFDIITMEESNEQLKKLNQENDIPDRWKKHREDSKVNTFGYGG